MHNTQYYMGVERTIISTPTPEEMREIIRRHKEGIPQEVRKMEVYREKQENQQKTE